MAARAPIKIQKGIKIPPRTGGPAAACIYPWKDMAIGDSFFMPRPERSASSMAGLAGRKYGRKFSVRSEGKGARVWRIA